MTSVSKDPRGDIETEAKEAKEDLELVWEAKEESTVRDQGETKEKEREEKTFIYGTITTEEPRIRFVFHNKRWPLSTITMSNMSTWLAPSAQVSKVKSVLN